MKSGQKLLLIRYFTGLLWTSEEYPLTYVGSLASDQ